MQNLAMWSWLAAGILLMLMEVLSPGFVIFFFGLAAVTVAPLCLVSGFGLAWQLVAFSVLSVVYLLGLRRLLKNVFKGDGGSIGMVEDELVGRVGKVVVAIRPDVAGRVLVGDAEWNAQSTAEISVGSEVKVLSRSNLTLTVQTL